MNGLLRLALLLAATAAAAACGSGSTGEQNATTGARSTLTPMPCPTPSSGESADVPSPLPSSGADLALPAQPCFARYQGIADVRGSTTFNLTIGRLGEGLAFFQPTILMGTAGHSLRLHITNTTPALHNFSILEQQINVDIDPGSTRDVNVVFPPRASAVYTCKYHGAEGHSGELVAVTS